MDQSQIDVLKAQHSDKDLQLISLELDEQEIEIVVVSPSKFAVKKYLHDLGKDDNAFNAAEQFVLSCIVHPDRASVQAILDKAPLLVQSINKQLEQMSGLNAKVSVKKL